MLTFTTLAPGSDKGLIELSRVRETSIVFTNSGFAYTLKVTLVQLAFSLVLAVFTLDELSDVTNFITPSVKPSFIPTVASNILLSFNKVS